MLVGVSPQFSRQEGRLVMRRSRYTKWGTVFVVLSLTLGGIGCLSTRDASSIVTELDKVWDTIHSTADSFLSVREIQVFGLNPELIGGIEDLASLPDCRLFAIYKLSGAYVFAFRKTIWDAQYLYVKRSDDGFRMLRRFDLAANEYLGISISASKLRYAPISRWGKNTFKTIWDSERDEILSVPSGFVGKVQCGGGIFLVECKSDKRLYVWVPGAECAPKEWGYKWLWEGSNSSFFVAENEKTGNRCAFVGGLVQIPGSDGAESITCGCISNGVQRYEISTADGKKIVYDLKISDIGRQGDWVSGKFTGTDPS